MADPNHPQESTDVPRGQKIWECPACARRYLTEQPPDKCPFCLRPVQR
jgi:rubrerythrin